MFEMIGQKVYRNGRLFCELHDRSLNLFIIGILEVYEKSNKPIYDKDYMYFIRDNILIKKTSYGLIPFITLENESDGSFVLNAMLHWLNYLLLKWSERSIVPTISVLKESTQC